MNSLRVLRSWATLVAMLSLVALAGWSTAAVDRAGTEARLLRDLEFLAGDQCEGRGITTKGINLAADYIAQEFKKAGLKPAGGEGSYFQPFSIAGGARLGQGNRVVLKGPLGQEIALEMGKHFTVVALGASGKLTAPVVFVGYGITSKEPAYDDYAGLNVEGKVVIVLRRVPNQQNGLVGKFSGGGNNPHAALLSKAANAGLHKAAGVLFVNDNVGAAENDQLMDFSYMAQSRESIPLPIVHLRRHLVNSMIRSTAGLDLSEIEKAIDREFRPQSFALDGWSCEINTSVQREQAEVKNVIAVLEGSGPLADETVVIGAHYDHLGYGGMGSLARGVKAIHYGADDNASGTAMVIELARRFADLGDRPGDRPGERPERKGRRLVFMTFTAEESGLLGSEHYCKHPVFPLGKTVAMVNMDMVGRLRDDKLIMYGAGTAKGFSELLDELNRKHQFKIIKHTNVADNFSSSDHEAFYRQGVPVLHLFTDTHPQYHRPSDTVNTLNVPGIAKITDYVEELTAQLATAEKRPEYVKVARSANPTPRMSGPRLGIMPTYGDDKEGVLLGGVTENTPAAKAGLKANDRIVEIAGKPIANIQAYMTAMSSFKKGDTLEITLVREGKKEKVKVVLE